MDKLKLNIQKFALNPPTAGNLIDEECLYEYHQNIKRDYAKKNSDNNFANLVVDSIRSKNMFDKNANIKIGYINSSGNVVTSDTTLSYQDNFIIVNPYTTYTISSSVSTIFRICEYTLSKTFIERKSNTAPNISFTFTTGANTYYLKMGGVYTTSILTLQLEKGSIATTYAPYQNLTGQENYSTGEIVIGTWIDGKPLYRKVVSDTVSTTNGAWKDFNPFNSNEIDTIVSLVGTFTYASGATVSIPYTRTTDNSYSNREYILANVHKYNGTLSVIAYHPSNYSGLMSGQKFRITVEYTKN